MTQLDRNTMIEGLQRRTRVQGPPPYEVNVVRPRPPANGNSIALELPIQDLHSVLVQIRSTSREQHESYEFQSRYPHFQYADNIDFEVDFRRTLKILKV
jgi:hypothetical protein